MPLANLQIISTILICLAVSVTVFAGIFITLLSPGFWGPFGLPNKPLSHSLLLGAIMGTGHGLITGLLFYWQKPDSFAQSIWTSFISTEVFLILAFVVTFVYQLTTVSLTISNIGGLIAVVTVYYIIFTVLLLIPSAVIGITNKFTLKFLIY